MNKRTTEQNDQTPMGGQCACDHSAFETDFNRAVAHVRRSEHPMKTAHLLDVDDAFAASPEAMHPFMSSVLGLFGTLLEVSAIGGEVLCDLRSSDENGTLEQMLVLLFGPMAMGLDYDGLRADLDQLEVFLEVRDEDGTRMLDVFDNGELVRTGTFDGFFAGAHVVAAAMKGQLARTLACLRQGVA